MDLSKATGILASAHGGSGSSSFAGAVSANVALDLMVGGLAGLCLDIDASKQPQITDGASIGTGSTIIDHSPSRNNFLVRGDGCTWSATGCGGLAGFALDGATYFDFSGALISPGAQPLTVIAVVKFDSLTSFPEVLQVGHDQSTTLASYQSLVGSNGSLQAGNFGAENNIITASGLVTTGTLTVLCFQFTGAALTRASTNNPTMSINGVATPATTGTVSGFTPVINPTTARIGANLSGSPAQYLTGEVARLIGCNAVPDVSAVIAGLTTRYGIS